MGGALVLDGKNNREATYEVAEIWFHVKKERRYYSCPLTCPRDFFSLSACMDFLVSSVGTSAEMLSLLSVIYIMEDSSGRY